MAMTLEQGVAACKAQNLGMTDCLALLSKNGVCGGNPVGAHFPDQNTVQFYCGAIPTTAEAAAQLKLALANVQQASKAATGDLPTWALLAGGAAFLGLGAWWVLSAR